MEIKDNLLTLNVTFECGCNPHQFSFVAFQFPFKNELQILVQNNDKPKESFHFETFDSATFLAIFDSFLFISITE